MPPLCLAGTWAAEGLCPSACTSVPLTFGPTFCFRALVPGLVAREVFTSQGHWPFACARLSFGIGSHLQCPPVTHCPIWGSAPWSVSRVFLTRRYWLRIQRPVGGVPAHELFIHCRWLVLCTVFAASVCSVLLLLPLTLRRFLSRRHL